MAIALPLPRPAILRTTLIQRLWLAAGGLAIFITTILAMRVTVAPSQPGEQTLGLDFLSFYTAGAVLNEGRANDLYDLKATQKFQTQVGLRDHIAVEGRYAPWWNPPFYALIFGPLAKLHFQTALLVWSTINMLCAALACWLLARMLPTDSPLHTWLIPTLLLISCPMFLTLTHGQNACMSLLLLTLTVYLWRTDRRFVAGLVGGLLFYKPQLAAVIAIVMTVDLGRRAFAGYVVTGTTLLAVNIIAMPGTIAAFLRTVPQNLNYVQNQCPYPWDRHATFKAFWRIAFQGEGIAPTSAFVTSVSITCIVIVAIALGRIVLKRVTENWIDDAHFSRHRYSGGGLGRGLLRTISNGLRLRKGTPSLTLPRSTEGGKKRTQGSELALHSRDRLIAATIAATPLLMPFYFDYDLLLLAVPAALVAADWISGDERPADDRWLLASFIALYLGMFFAPDLAERLRFSPVPPLVALIVFLLIRRANLPRLRSTRQLSQSDSNCRTPACS